MRFQAPAEIQSVCPFDRDQLSRTYKLPEDFELIISASHAAFKFRTRLGYLLGQEDVVPTFIGTVRANASESYPYVALIRLDGRPLVACPVRTIEEGSDKIAEAFELLRAKPRPTTPMNRPHLRIV